MEHKANKIVTFLTTLSMTLSGCKPATPSAQEIITNSPTPISAPLPTPTKESIQTSIPTQPAATETPAPTSTPSINTGLESLTNCQINSAGNDNTFWVGGDPNKLYLLRQSSGIYGAQHFVTDASPNTIFIVDPRSMSFGLVLATKDAKKNVRCIDSTNLTPEQIAAKIYEEGLADRVVLASIFTIDLDSQTTTVDTTRTVIPRP